MSHQDDPFTSLDSESLDAVTGGVTSSTSNSQVATALQGIQGSLSSLGQGNNNSSGNVLSQMLPLLMFARGGGGGGGGGGGAAGACPCGCGMANCVRR
jgi:hypothetical protein